MEKTFELVTRYEEVIRKSENYFMKCLGASGVGLDCLSDLTDEQAILLKDGLSLWKELKDISLITLRENEELKENVKELRLQNQEILELLKDMRKSSSSKKND